MDTLPQHAESACQLHERESFLRAEEIRCDRDIGVADLCKEKRRPTRRDYPAMNLRNFQMRVDRGINNNNFPRPVETFQK